MNPSDARELLEAAHQFPGPFTIKVIGHSRDGFAERALVAARGGVVRELAIEHSARLTPNGDHVAVTLCFVTESADEVLAIYRELGKLDGLKMLM